MRIGHGFDVHAFGEGSFITLGGVRIPHSRGLIAHSDGDVLLHALCDALLGAAGLGDIGRHFPDSSAEFKNIDSRILLRRVAALVGERRLAVGNVDATIIAQAPKMALHIPAMIGYIAADLEIAPERVNIKATTTERLGYIGRGEGIAVHAVVLLQEEPYEMGSYNHSYVQANLVWLLKSLGQYSVLTDLSLDISSLDLSKFNIKIKEEIKPDVCIYPKRGLSRPDDILKMTEMPLLAIEILSPKQGTYDILQKFKIYFELGVQSCWLVEPAIGVVTVYSSIDHYQNFISGDVIDEKLNIRLPISDVFG